MAKRIFQTNRFNKVAQQQQDTQNMNQENAIEEGEETLVDIAQVRNQASSFFEHYQKPILGVLIGAAVIFGAWYAYKNLYVGPRQKRAVEQMYQAEQQFEKDSFALALTNPGGGFSGFLDIISSYSGTPAANMAKYYAGVSYLNLGQFENATKYLGEFSASGDVAPIMKNGALGDAYSELNKMDEAMGYYKKAVSSGDHELLTAYYLKKVAMLSEKSGDFAGAKEAYQTLKEKYSRSPDGRDADKFLERISAKVK